MNPIALNSSASGRQWSLCQVDEEIVEGLRMRLGCPRAIAKLLVMRGVTDEALARIYLEPALADLHDPFLMLGMTAAVERIRRAVEHCEPILIYGDYDVDGTTATVLLKTAIDRLVSAGRPSARVTCHIPHRLLDGYGMQNSRLTEASEAGVRLIISVDTGIRAFNAAVEAKALGMDLIVTDHHLPDGVAGLPDALAVLNPAQPGCKYPNKHLCGAGVAFKLAHALLATRAVTPSEEQALNDRLLPSFLKLVAIATIADSVELSGENRTMVGLGLRELRNPVQPGLRALMQVAKLPFDRSPTATEVGFRLAPRINAAGRMDTADAVIELFSTRDPERAETLAAKLDLLNDQRRATERAALEAIDLQLAALRDADGVYDATCIVLDHPEWHRGVLGILASRIVDRTGRPALVITSDKLQAHGSGRSVLGFHLLDALTEIHCPPEGNTNNDLFTRFGGHAHAVGFSLPTANLALLRERMQVHSAAMLTPQLLAPIIFCDLEVGPGELNADLCHWLARLAPFGAGNPEPRFLARELTLAAPPRLIKEKHVCLSLTHAPDARSLSAIGWSNGGGMCWPERCDALKLDRGSVIDAIFRVHEITQGSYAGIELQLIDIASPQVAPASHPLATT